MVNWYDNEMNAAPKSWTLSEAADGHLVITKEPTMRNDSIIPPTLINQPPKPIYILVTGTRHGSYSSWIRIIQDAIREHSHGQPYHLVQGGARGIDLIACHAAIVESDIKAAQIHEFPADWKQWGKGAGPKRNSQMRDFLVERVALGHTAICLAFHDDLNSSKGTKDMVQRATAVGIPVHVYDGKVARP